MVAAGDLGEADGLRRREIPALPLVGGCTKGRPMAGLTRKNIDKPDEVRQMKDGKGRLELVDLGSGLVARATFEPGWKWSEHVKPMAGTDSCQAAHVGYVISGRMKIVMDDGEETEIGPGDFMTAAPGHDAWIIGNEPCVIIDWQGMADYAKS